MSSWLQETLLKLETYFWVNVRNVGARQKVFVYDRCSGPVNM